VAPIRRKTQKHFKRETIFNFFGGGKIYRGETSIWGDYLIWLAIIIWVIWIIKQILGLDPASIENFLSAIPWAAAIFGAGGFYEKMKWIGRELERLSSKVKDLRDKVMGLQERVARIEGKLNAPQ